MKVASAKKKPPAAKKPSEPIMIECDECQGCGEVHASCEECNVALTTANVEEGSDSLCRKCAKEEDDFYQ